MNTDLIIIGAGPGGYRAAEYAAKQGLQVVIIEQDEVGGTCLNRGCIPTKTYVHAASFDEARERMGQVVPLLRSGVEGILAHPNITLMRGTASFLDSQTVNVSGDTVVAKNIIIATGSSAKLLPLPDINDPRLVTSTELLQCPTLPKRLAIIGAGVIGMEFASVFHRFGSEVTVIEYLKECLPMVDSDIAKRLRKLLEKWLQGARQTPKGSTCLPQASPLPPTAPSPPTTTSNVQWSMVNVQRSMVNVQRPTPSVMSTANRCWLMQPRCRPSVLSITF